MADGDLVYTLPADGDPAGWREPSGDSQPVRYITGSFSFDTPNITTTGIVLGSMVEGETLLQGQVRVVTGFNAGDAADCSLFVDAAGGEGLLDGGTFDLVSSSDGTKVAVPQSIEDGVSQALDDLDVVLVANLQGTPATTGEAEVQLMILTP